ncbi:hypothetical protein [Tateyamaria sp. ANG-S1]|uniref:hypothetical protein n=1 Tax=Tateyamaria sp. ANG-S1 TaxID=1577905 RepID=UPI000A846077|nr:hypothetical protein [Tateyamaria sp. ANG-S1]
MRIIRNTLAGAAFAIAAMGSAASALSVDFTGSDPAPANQLMFDFGNLTLTVTAGTFPRNPNPGNINFNTRLVDQDNDGLGADAPFFDSDQIDGFFGNDVLVFSFSREVTLDSILFGNVDGNDDFAFGSVVGSSFSRIVSFQDVPTTSFDLAGISPNGENIGLSFGIGAIGRNDDFTVAGLSFTPTPIPLPATGFLLLGALGLGAAGARMRRKQA